MRLMFTTSLTALAVVLGATAIAATAEAQGWPNGPVNIVVPFKAGGTSDQTARIFQKAIKENNLLDVPVTVTNVGGHFSIGARRVLEADPDGQEFLLIHVALMGGEGAGQIDFGYRDFDPVATTGEFCLAPMVRKDSGYNSLDDLLTDAANRPGEIVFGANLGAINHLAGIMLQNAKEGAAFRFVQIGGGTANFTALTGKTTQATVLSLAEVKSFTRNADGSPLEEAQIKPLAVTQRERSPGLPDVPTTFEQGFPVQFCVTSWWFAPKGTPQAAIDGMADVLEAAASSATVQDFWAGRLFSPTFRRGAAMKKELDDTFARILPVAQQAGQSVQK